MKTLLIVLALAGANPELTPVPKAPKPLPVLSWQQFLWMEQHRPKQMADYIKRVDVELPTIKAQCEAMSAETLPVCFVSRYRLLSVLSQRHHDKANGEQFIPIPPSDFQHGYDQLDKSHKLKPRQSLPKLN